MGKKVLVADDNLTTRIILRKNLTRWGFEVVEAQDGLEAWEILAGDNSPKLAILDWMMPGLDGPGICRKARELFIDRLVYIILLTTRSEKSDMLAGFSSGADDYLTKPIDSEELRSRLNAGLRIVDFDERLRDEEFRVRLECYQALTELAEARDNETGAHLKRIGVFCSTLAVALGQTDKYCTDIAMFSPMHDMGKVAIPDNILLAPRKLTAEEFEIMKTHAILGWQILRGKPTLEMAAEICLTHHEKHDGTGYPHGLRGDRIPLSGKISTIADIYDALRSKRHYKPAWTHEATINHMKSIVGTTFDPDVFKAFWEKQQEFARIFESYADAQEGGEEDKLIQKETAGAT